MRPLTASPLAPAVTCGCASAAASGPSRDVFAAQTAEETALCDQRRSLASDYNTTVITIHVYSICFVLVYILGWIRGGVSALRVFSCLELVFTGTGLDTASPTKI